MNTKMIDGKRYAQMLLGGAGMLAIHIKELNALNVFPVADGDTGTNMLSTIEGGLAAIKNLETDSIGELSKAFSRGILLSARGNSGVILSQIFSGINEVLEGHDRVSAQTLAQAYESGIKKSYAAVQKPTEGTILTVFRESTEYAVKYLTEDSTLEDFYRFHIERAKSSLEETKTILPALAEADVVDSGAAGYLYIAEGMQEVLEGKEVSYEMAEQKNAASTVDIDSFTRDSILEYGYCTEFLLRLTVNKTDPDKFEIAPIVELLKSMGGDSIVAYKQDDIVKVHVHTFTPGDVLAKMQAYGEFLTVKIENMNLGHTDDVKEEPEQEIAKPKAPKKNFAVIAVAQGDGMSALFTQMGVDRIVSGGQSANPSIEDFIDAFKECDAENIIVLPNNKNIVLAAKQAAQIYTDATVYVINTKNIAQGYSALSVITPGIKDIEALIASVENAAGGVIDGEITCAVRNTVVDGKNISVGDYISISGGSIVAVEKTPEDAVMAMLENVDIDLCEIITLFVGKSVSTEKRAELTEIIEEAYEDYELTVYEGGQDVYDYLVAIE